MMEFPLLSLNSTNLEQVINKLDQKSYFRLQQTCRDVDEFIHNSPNISVHINKEILYPAYNDQRKDCWWPSGFENVEGLYATRLASFVHHPYCSTKADAARIWKVLKRNRITSKELVLPELLWTVEECAPLIDSAKPVEIDFDSVGSNAFEALLQSKTLQKVQLHLGHRHIPMALPQLLPRFQKLEIFDETSPTDSLDLPRTFLQCLFSGSFPNLLELTLHTPWGDGLAQIEWDDTSPSVEEMQQALGDYELTLEVHHYCYLVFSVKLPAHFPPGAACLLRFVRCEYAQFEYYVV